MSLLLLLAPSTGQVVEPNDEGYTDAVVGILTVAPTTGIFTSPANRN